MCVAQAGIKPQKNRSITSNRNISIFFFDLKALSTTPLTFLLKCFEDLDVRDADIGGIFSARWNVRMHSLLVEAAGSSYFNRPPTAL